MLVVHSIQENLTSTAQFSCKKLGSAMCPCDPGTVGTSVGLTAVNQAPVFKMETNRAPGQPVFSSGLHAEHA